MATEAWLDQLNLATVWGEAPSARLDQASLAVVWSEPITAEGWLDQLNLATVWSEEVTGHLDQLSLAVVWAESIGAPTFASGSAANMFEQVSDMVDGYADHESSAQKTKRCEDHFSEDYDDDSLASAFYAMEN
jgi:hypothetical protein